MDELKKNKAGGINDLRHAALERAKKADLITLSPEVRGTNCFNCRWIKDKMKGYGWCINKNVDQYVNGRMCCNFWSHKGDYRPYPTPKTVEGK